VAAAGFLLAGFYEALSSELIADVEAGGPAGHMPAPFATGPLVGHSYGGMITREFAARYPGQVAGMVLADASSEPGVAAYDRLHAGPWIDGTVQPAHNQRINIHATVRQLEQAPSLVRIPLIVGAAGILQDRWLKTVPELEARAPNTARLLSADAIHVVNRGIGHLIPSQNPQIVIAAAQTVLAAAASGHPLAACLQIFRSRPPNACTAGSWAISEHEIPGNGSPPQERRRPHRACKHTRALADSLAPLWSAPRQSRQSRAPVTRLRRTELLVRAHHGGARPTIRSPPRSAARRAFSPGASSIT
jgi:hypothetical protein